MQHCVLTAPDRNRDGLVAIVVVTPQTCARWNVNNCEDITPMGSEEAAKAVPGELQAEMLSLLQTAGGNAGSDAHEIPVAVVVECREWSEETGQLTLTGKVQLANAALLALTTLC